MSFWMLIIVIKYVFGSDNFDVIALCDTWLGSTTHKVCLAKLVPQGFSIKHVPRTTTTGGDWH